MQAYVSNHLNAILGATSIPDFSSPFSLCVDASNDGLGPFLNNEERKPVVIAYGGRKLTKQEQQYPTTEREALAVVDGIKRYRSYLHGQQFYVITDHGSLKWLMGIKDPTGRLAHWALTIQQYDFEIIHRPGVSHSNADCLSRYPFGTKFNDVNINAFTGLSPQLERVRKLQQQDPFFAALITHLCSNELPTDDALSKRVSLQHDHYYLNSDGFLYHLDKPNNWINDDWRQQLVIPVDLREDLLFQMHDEPTAGHFGISRTSGKRKQHYFWPGVIGVSGAETRSVLLLYIPRRETDYVSSGYQNAWGPFPVTYSNNKYIVVISDYLTKLPEAFAVPDIEAATIAEILLHSILSRHGASRILLSDRGSNFMSKLISELCCLLHIKKVNTTVYHPQTDGLVERSNGTLAKSLSMYTSSNQKDWDVYIPSLLFGYCVTPHASTGESPFYLFYGREPRLPVDVMLSPSKNLSTSIFAHRDQIVKKLTRAHEVAQVNIKKMQDAMKRHYDLRATDPKRFVGDRVWVFTPKVPPGLTRKLEHLRHGPFRILEQLSPVHYQLGTCDNRKVTTKVHANLLKLYYDRNDRPIGHPSVDVNEPYLNFADLPDDSQDDTITASDEDDVVQEHAVAPTDVSLLNDTMAEEHITNLNDNVFSAGRSYYCLS
eukprot:gene7615-8455_t